MNNNESVQHDSNIEHQIEQGVTPEPTAFDQAKYSEMSLEEKFAASKASAFKKLGVQENVQAAPTVAETIAAQENSKMTVHQDGSISTQKGILGNDKASSDLIKILREQAYQRHNITD